MGYRQGNCGRSARWYGDELAVLYGVLATEDDAKVWPREREPRPDPKIPLNGASHCEHGVRLSKDCPTCDFMFGLKPRDN